MVIHGGIVLVWRHRTIWREKFEKEGEGLQEAFYGESAGSTNKDRGHNPAIPLLSQHVSRHLTLAISFIV